MLPIAFPPGTPISRHYLSMSPLCSYPSCESNQHENTNFILTVCFFIPSGCPALSLLNFSLNSIVNRVLRAKTARPSDSVSQKTTLPKLQLEQHHATTYWRTRFCPLLHHLWTWPTMPRHLRHSNNTSLAHKPPFSWSSSSVNENSLRKIKIKAHCECYHGFVVYVWLEDRVLAVLFADAFGSVAGRGGLVLKW